MIALLRRVVLVLLLCLTSLAVAADAQQAKVQRLGYLNFDSEGPPGHRDTFRDMMRELGYIYGQNLIVDERWSDGRNERFPSLAAELVALKPDVIVAESAPAVIAAMRATATIPIVMVNVADPVGSGLVASLARPGGNVTGAATFGIETAEKSVDLMHVLVPKATRIAILMTDDNPDIFFRLKAIEDAAKTIGLTVLPTMFRSEEDFEKAIASMAKKDAQALIFLAGGVANTDRNQDKLIELAARTKLPTMHMGRSAVEAGGLLSYGHSRLERKRFSATYVDKILKGAKPADLPIAQPTTFDFFINLKTAKALGLTIPQSLLLRATEVIQ